MEQNNWIENILKSANGITTVVPSDDLFFKIQHRIQNESKVSPKAVWLVAASIAILVLLNFSIINSKSKQTKDSTTTYLEMTVNQSNQLYK